MLYAFSLKNLYLLIIERCVTGIFGGFLLGVRSVTGLAFYDWETLELVRRIEIQPRHVFWSESGELVCLATEESYFILKYDSSVVARAHESKEGLTEDGVEEAFTVSLILLNDVELNIVLFEHPSKISNKMKCYILCIPIFCSKIENINFYIFHTLHSYRCKIIVHETSFT